MQERAHRDDVELAPAVEEEGPTKAQPTGERYAEGAPPPVTAGAGATSQTASQLAFEEDDNVRELKQKVAALVNAKFGGDYHKAFDHYGGANSQDGLVNSDELKALLSDAGVGNGLTRGRWVKGIIDKLDRDKDGMIAWQEFESVVTKQTA